jgi:single-stranded-DNA-specific exonuclease
MLMNFVGERFSTPRLVMREASIPRETAELAKAVGISDVTARILLARGINTPEEVRNFLNPTLREHLPDPAQMLNLPAAATLLLDAVAAKRSITIFHDFDVDGLTAGAQLTEFLKRIGGQVRCYVPNRLTEGYGLSKAAVDRIIEAGTEILVTVDCGIGNVEEIAHAKAKGLTVLVLDHHQPAELPPADIIVDPAQAGCPFQRYKLAAAGVVWMLLIVLRRLARERFADESKIPDPKEFLDLAALGTICDMVPLHEVNRLIALRGIEAMQNTRRVGLRALMEVSGVFGKPRFGAGQISFALGPRINAAGRLDDATQVGELFATGDQKTAKRLAEKIDRLNSQRRSIEEQVKKACLAQLYRDPSQCAAAAVAVFGEEYHPGVIGIVAQRLVEEFHRPAAVMAPGETVYDGQTVQVAKGSVRSISGFNVAEVLHDLAPMLISGGGHEAAGGFTVLRERLDEFRQAFIEEAEKRLTADHLQREIKADVEAPLGAVDFVLAEELQRLAPFGVGNSSPTLVSENVTVDSAQPLSDKHLRLRLVQGTTARAAVGWGFLGHPKARKGEQVTAVYQVDINSYQGVASVQLNLKALL